MSLRLPASDSPIRELFDVAALAQMVIDRTVLTFRGAIGSAHRAMCADGAIKSVNVICMRADGEIWLIEVSRPRFVGSTPWRKLWNFGKP